MAARAGRPPPVQAARRRGSAGAGGAGAGACAAGAEEDAALALDPQSSRVGARARGARVQAGVLWRPRRRPAAGEEGHQVRCPFHAGGCARGEHAGGGVGELEVHFRGDARRRADAAVRARGGVRRAPAHADAGGGQEVRPVLVSAWAQPALRARCPWPTTTTSLKTTKQERTARRRPSAVKLSLSDVVMHACLILPRCLLVRCQLLGSLQRQRF